MYAQSERCDSTELPIRQHWKGELQEMGVVDGKANHDAHQLKLHAHINVGGSEPVHARLLIQLEHSVVGIKQVAYQ